MNNRGLPIRSIKAQAHTVRRHEIALERDETRNVANIDGFRDAAVLRQFKSNNTRMNRDEVH